jgi:hypothetical protein
MDSIRSRARSEINRLRRLRLETHKADCARIMAISALKWLSSMDEKLDLKWLIEATDFAAKMSGEATKSEVSQG